MKSKPIQFVSILLLLLLVDGGVNSLGRALVPLPKTSFINEPRLARSLKPTSYSIEGSIIDNYVNLSVSLTYENPNDTATEISWMIPRISDLVILSNISVQTANGTLWGRAMELLEAQTLYSQSVEENVTAALITEDESGYLLKLNIEAESTLILTVYFEGLLLREFGRYKLDLPLYSSELYPDLDVNLFNLELEIISHYSELTAYKIEELPSIYIRKITDGISMEYTAPSGKLPSMLHLEYALEDLGGSSQILTYTNGTESFFAFLLAPQLTSDMARPSREYVFVVDCSGSMVDTIDQVKQAFNAMIDDMSPEDRFNVISFNSVANSLWSASQFATADHVKEAKDWVNELNAEGSTNFYEALQRGLQSFKTTYSAKVLLLLSDGAPTSGEITETEGLLAHARKLNTMNVSISTISFGTYADTQLMTGLAVENHGYFTFVDPTEDPTENIMLFYQKLAVPVASSYSISTKGATELLSLQSLEKSPFFNGTEVLLAGRYNGELLTVTAKVYYASGPELYVQTAQTPSASGNYRHLERIWAQYKIASLLVDALTTPSNASIRQCIVTLALRYGLIVPGYTAIVLTALEVDLSTYKQGYENGAVRQAANEAPFSLIGIIGFLVLASSFRLRGRRKASKRGLKTHLSFNSRR